MRADGLSPDDSNADMFGYLRVDAGWLWKPKRLLIHTAPTAASVEISYGLMSVLPENTSARIVA